LCLDFFRAFFDNFLLLSLEELKLDSEHDKEDKLDLSVEESPDELDSEVESLPLELSLQSSLE